MTLASELQKIHDDHGVLTPVLVVKAAAPEAHPLHRYFEWNDKAAGEKYRIDQARQLIRSVRQEVLDTSPEGPRYVRGYLSTVDETGRSYRKTDEVLSSDELRNQVMAAFDREVKLLLARNSVFKAVYLEWLKAQLSDELNDA